MLGVLDCADKRGSVDLREHDSRTRLAETCGARDESPSSNLGRVKKGEASRADVMRPKVDGKMA